MNKEPFEKRFEKFITSKIYSLHKGNISRKELFVVFVSRAEYLPQLKTGEYAGMQSKGAFDWEIRISISDFGFWISQ